MKELNLLGTRLSEESVNFLVKNLSTKISKLSLGYLRFVKDVHVRILARRSPQNEFSCFFFKFGGLDGINLFDQQLMTLMSFMSFMRLIKEILTLGMCMRDLI